MLILLFFERYFATFLSKSLLIEFTEKISSSQVSVPIYPGLNKEEVIDILQKNWSGNGVSNSIL